MTTKTGERSTCPYPGDTWTSDPQQSKAGAAARLIEHLIDEHVEQCPDDVAERVKLVTGQFK